MSIKLSLAAVRALLLAAQGLEARPERPATKDDVLESIRRMGALQIDTIHVVARSPYLVLWSRLGTYEPTWLDQLLDEHAIFEYWAHEACFLPIEDYPLYRRLMLELAGRAGSWARSWVIAHPEAAEAMLAYVRERGPVRSADFERNDGQKSGWWNWKLEKRALEMLYTTGELMIAGRRNFQRIYDLRERVLPDWDDTHAPPLEVVRRELVLRAVGALGATPARWVADYFRTSKKATLAIPAALAHEGALIPVEVEGHNEPWYIHPTNLALAAAAAEGELHCTRTTLLSPFDPVVWDRERALALFDFAYRIECYTPASKRRYGYFTLPILHRGRLIGRLDPKAHRREKLFEVKALHLEPGVTIDDGLIAGLAGALRACADWHGTPEISIRQSDPPQLRKTLELAFQHN